MGRGWAAFGLAWLGACARAQPTASLPPTAERLGARVLCDAVVVVLAREPPALWTLADGSVAHAPRRPAGADRMPYTGFIARLERLDGAPVAVGTTIRLVMPGATFATSDVIADFVQTYEVGWRYQGDWTRFPERSVTPVGWQVAPSSTTCPPRTSAPITRNRP